MSEQPEHDDKLADRVEHLEDGQNKILAKLDQLVGGVHTRAEERTEDRLGRPSTVEEQVQRELKRKEDEEKARAAKAADQEERKTLKQELADMRAKLTEKLPEQPQPRRQRLMWGPK